MSIDKKMADRIKNAIEDLNAEGIADKIEFDGVKTEHLPDLMLKIVDEIGHDADYPDSFVDCYGDLFEEEEEEKKDEPKTEEETEETEEETEETEEEKEEEVEEEKEEEKPKEKTKKTKKTKKEKTKGGVIKTIAMILHEGWITKSEILEKLKSEFPDRSPESMKKTITTQLSGKMNKDKNIGIVEKNGKYRIKKKIKDWSEYFRG